MNLLNLSWKNLTRKPLNMLLSLILFALGVGMISMLLLLNKQVQDKFDKNLGGINLVVGAKGSPLQLILCSMYHIDTPTGNVSLKEVRPFMNPKHPLIEKAVPLSLGDSHKGYRLVGTTHDLLSFYDGKIGQGKIWNRDFEVVAGAAVAEALNLTVGTSFHSSHGFVIDDNLVHDDGQAFKVVGILEPSGSVLDQLILTNTQSVWKVHDGHSHDEDGGHDHGAHDHGEEAHDHAGHDHGDHGHEGHDHDDHAHEGHDHDDHEHEGHEHGDHDGHDHSGHDHAAHEVPVSKSLLEEDPSKEITSLLVKFKTNNFQTLNMQRSINENTDMQAATPAIEMNRLYSMMGVGTDALRTLAMIIVFVSGLSIFISLFSSLKERKYELSLMRVMGATRMKLLILIILEGLLLAILGFIIGIALSHFGMNILANYMESSYKYSFTGWMFLKEEIWLLAGALLIGFIAAIIPAVQAYNTDITETLSKG